MINKVALIAGGSKRIGASICRALAAEGARVVINYSSSRNEAVRRVAEIAADGGTAISVQANVASHGNR